MLNGLRILVDLCIVVDIDDGGAAEEKEKAELSTEDDKDAAPPSLLWLLMEVGKTWCGVRSSSKEKKASEKGELPQVRLVLLLWRFDGVMTKRLAMGFATTAAGATILPPLFLWRASTDLISSSVLVQMIDGGVVNGVRGRIGIGGGVMASRVVAAEIL